MGLNGLSKEYILMSIKPHYQNRRKTPCFNYGECQRRLVDTTGISGGRVDVFEDPQRLDG